MCQFTGSSRNLLIFCLPFFLEIRTIFFSVFRAVIPQWKAVFIVFFLHFFLIWLYFRVVWVCRESKSLWRVSCSYIEENYILHISLSGAGHKITELEYLISACHCRCQHHMRWIRCVCNPGRPTRSACTCISELKTRASSGRLPPSSVTLRAPQGTVSCGIYGRKPQGNHCRLFQKVANHHSNGFRTHPVCVIHTSQRILAAWLNPLPQQVAGIYFLFFYLML